MLRRLSIIALLLFEAFWLNVVVPGHTRGVVVLPGTKQAVMVAPCCAAREPNQKGSHQPTPAEQGGCAVCFFAAHLSTPPVIDYRPQPLELLAILAPPRSVSSETVSIPAVHCRGPPVL